jgi:hypothetical protein
MNGRCLWRFSLIACASMDLRFVDSVIVAWWLFDGVELNMLMVSFHDAIHVWGWRFFWLKPYLECRVFLWLSIGDLGFRFSASAAMLFCSLQFESRAYFEPLDCLCLSWKSFGFPVAFFWVRCIALWLRCPLQFNNCWFLLPLFLQLEGETDPWVCSPAVIVYRFLRRCLVECEYWRILNVKWRLSSFFFVDWSFFVFAAVRGSKPANGT